MRSLALGIALLVAAVARADHEAYPPFPSPGAIAEAPREDSVLGFGAVEVADRDDQPIVSLEAGGEYYLRSWFATRGAVVVPVTTESGGRQAPVQLQGGGTIHPFGTQLVDAYLVVLAGLEINRNASDGAVQPFADAGLGLQLFLAGLIVLRLEGRYHLSNIPQQDGTTIGNSYFLGHAALGLFF